VGDRGNIVVRGESKKPSTDVWFYTHWSGSDIAKVVTDGMKRAGDRRTDEAYLARVLFCQLLADNPSALTETTGYGISTGMCDNEHDVLLVDVTAQIVYVVPRREAESDWNLASCKDDLVSVSFPDIDKLVKAFEPEEPEEPDPEVGVSQ